MKKYFIFALLVLTLCVSAVCAADDMGENSISNVDDSSVVLEKNEEMGDNDDSSLLNVENNDEKTIGETNLNIYITKSPEDELEETNPVIVENWEDIEYYASKTDKNYVIKLKENTNYYPKEYSSGGTIVIRNNLTILGNSGAYIGFSTKNVPQIQFSLFKIERDSKLGVVLDGVLFKYISSNKGSIFELGGDTNNTVKNCKFENIKLFDSKSTLLYIKKGLLTVENCTFINSTHDYGCISVYCPEDSPTTLCTSSKAIVKDCYFENNYATNEPGCINNCGLLTVYNTTFYNNRASVWAGAIHTHSGANTTIYDSKFINNLAGWNGGALYTYSYLQIYNTSFIGNNCTTNFGGGAIGACVYQTSPHIYIEDCFFENNENLCWALDELSTEGTGRGGAISIMDTGSLKVYNTTFVKNSASIGPAISAHAEVGYGSPDIEISGNRFINNTRAGDVLVIKVDSTENLLHDNYYYNNSMEYSIFSLSVLRINNDEVTFEIESKLKNPEYYDEDILDKCEYDVYVDGEFIKKITGNQFSLNFEDIKTYEVYVVASISKKISNIVPVTINKDLIYVSKNKGNDNNNGLSENTPVYSLKKAIELARSTGNIFIIDGSYDEQNLIIDYNLSIFANNASISNISIEDTIFESNSKLVLKDFNFSNIKNLKNNSTLINQNSGLLIIDRCVFDSNEFNTIIDAKNIEMRNIIFENNNGSIKTENLTLSNVSFVNNSGNYLIMSKENAGNWNIINSKFINNLNLVLIYYSSQSNSLTIENSIFKNNNGLNSLIIDDYGKLLVSSSIFVNDSIINLTNSNVLATVKDSVILNSNNFIDGIIVNENINCNYNWWGNINDDNINSPLNLNPNIQIDNWLFLNILSNLNILEFNQNETIKFSLNNLMTSKGDILKYKYNLPKLNFSLTPINAKINKNSIVLENMDQEVIYSLTGNKDGVLNVNYETFETSLNYTFIKSDVEKKVVINPITVRNDAKIEIILSEYSTGNLTIKLNNYIETKVICDKNTIFTVSGLDAGNYTVEIIYSGDEIYNSFSQNTSLIVNKIPNDIIISIGDVKLGNDVLITIITQLDATGNVSVNVNGNNATLEIQNGKVYYKINNITKGDWEIKAVYEGDNFYSRSESYKKFGVGKIDSSVMINVLNSRYKEDVVIEVYLNNDATGNITVIVDDKNKTAELHEGKVVINLSDISAGNKKLKVVYSGDFYYNNATYSSSFMIEKINTYFNMSCDCIMEGKLAIVKIELPYGVTGTITFQYEDIKETLTIPKSGFISWTLPVGLSAGEHIISATYNGDINYYIAKNNTKVFVNSWNSPQWANEGYGIDNNGKSPYNSNVNGQIKWFVENNDEKLGNIVIDSEGNVYIITQNCIISYDEYGYERWNYTPHTLNSFSGMAIGRDVIISPVSGDTLYFINQTTGKQFGYSNIYQASSVFAPVIDENCNIYITGEKEVSTRSFYLVVVPYNLWEIGGTPTLISLDQSNPTTAPVIVSENIVCIGTDEGLKIVDTSSNTVINNFKDVITNVRPIVNEGVIYVATKNSIVALDVYEGELWKNNFSALGCKYMVFDDERSVIYSIDSIGNLYKYDAVNSGEETLISDLNITSGILLGNGGELYVGNNNTLISFSSEGKLLWKSDIGDKIIGTPVMSKNGLIYLTTTNGLFAIEYAPLKDPILQCSVNNVCYGNDVNFSMSVNQDVTGEIILKINNDTFIYNIHDCNFDISISDLKCGNYEIHVVYTGDGRYFSVDKIVYFNVTKKESSSNNIDIPSVITSTSPSFSINLPSDATGTLTVEIDAIKYSVELEKGSARLNVPKLSSGKHNIIVSYSGDENYAPITINKIVSVPLPKLINNRNIVMDYNDGSSYKVQLIGSDGKIIVGDYVTFNINGKIIKVKTNNKGYASVVITQTPKKYTIAANYNGVSVKNTITVKQILKSVNYKVKKSAKKLVLKATLKSSKGKALKGKRITFKFNGKTYKAKTNKKGIAKVTINKKVIKKLKINKKYALRISYLKDTIKKTVSVKK